MDSEDFVNAGKDTITWKWSGYRSMINTNTFTQSTTKTYRGSITITVSAGLPGIAEVGTTAGFTWDVAYTTTQETSTSTTVEVGGEIGGTLQPGEKVTAVTYCQSGSLIGLTLQASHSIFKILAFLL